MLNKKHKHRFEKVMVRVEGAKNKVISYQCSCGDFKFDKKSGYKVLKELRAKSKSPLNIEQKITKISHNRLGIYFDKNVIRTMDLSVGKNVLVSVPDKEHIIISLKD